MALVSNFGFRKIAFHLLVVSTVNMFSIVSSQTSKHFFQSCSLPTPHSVSAHCCLPQPHLLPTPPQGKLVCVTYLIFFWKVAMTSSLPSDLQDPWSAPWDHVRTMTAPRIFTYSTTYHNYYNV